LEFAALQAIKGVLKQHFVLHEPKVDFFFSGPKSEDLADELLRDMTIDISIRVIRLDKVEEPQINFPSIFLFDSDDYFYDMTYKIEWASKTGVFHNHLIYAPRRRQIDIIAYLSQMNFAFENQNFIKIVNDTTVDLVTSFRFTPGNCNSTNYKAINRFSTKTMKWEDETFFPDKNFHGCPLRVAHSSEHSSSDYFASFTSQAIFVILSETLNFQLKRVQVTEFLEEKDKFDVVEFLQYHETYSYYSYEFSSSLFVIYMTYTVPAGEPYTQLEKMFLMFDKETWICIGVTLLLAVVVIQVINFMSIQVQKFVFGRDIRTPTLNIASIFLNGAQHRVPGRNFARFLLMMFIIWSLIIRTCYQSILYKDLQTDLRKPRMHSVEDLNEHKFTLLHYQGADDHDEVLNKRYLF
jgi:hypothetical protein